MKRNATITPPVEEPAYLTQAEKKWMEGAADFLASDSEAEDWSFLTTFTPDHQEQPESDGDCTSAREAEAD